MARVIGVDLRPGDRVGSIDLWTIRVVGQPTGGSCTDRVAAVLGTCWCTRPDADPADLPTVDLVGTDLTYRRVYAHVRYAITQRPAGRR